MGAAAPHLKGPVDWDDVCLHGNQWDLMTHSSYMLGSQEEDWGMGDPHSKRASRVQIGEL